MTTVNEKGNNIKTKKAFNKNNSGAEKGKLNVTSNNRMTVKGKKPAPVKKTPIATTDYSKMFNSFEEAVASTYEILPEFKDIMNGVSEFGDFQNKAALLAVKKTPNILTGHNKFWEVQLAAKRGSIKTDKLFAVSWYVSSKFVDGKAVSNRYLMTITVIGKGSVQNTMISDIKAAGWTDNKSRK